MRFKTHSELMSYLLLAEKEHHLLLKNEEHKSAMEVNTIELQTRRSRGSRKSQQQQPNWPYPSKSNDKSSNHSSNSQSQSQTRKCHKCGRTGHLQRDCRATECSKCGCFGHVSRDCQTGECQKCSRPGHVSQECRADEYVVKMYKELQQLKKGQRESHSLDAPSLDGIDLENYMTIAVEYSGAQPIVTSVYSMS